MTFSESLITAQSSNNKPIDYKMKRSANDAQTPPPQNQSNIVPIWFLSVLS